MSLSSTQIRKLLLGAGIGALGALVLLLVLRVAGPLAAVEPGHIVFALTVCPLLGALVAWLRVRRSG